MITTADGKIVEEGSRDLLFNYYDMQFGRIAWDTVRLNGGGVWFQFNHQDGSHTLLNGERICTPKHALKMGWLGDTSQFA